MCLHYNLHACKGDLGQESSHQSLPCGVKVYLWVLNDEYVPFVCRKSGHDNWQDLGQTEACMDWTMEIHRV